MRQLICALWELDATSHRALEELSLTVSGRAFLCTSFHPHITLGCYEGLKDRQLRPWLRSFARQIAPFDVSFEEVGLLASDRAACFPAFMGPLRRHYEAFHQRFDDHADQWTRLSNGLYTPHVSLYQAPDGQVDRAAQRRLEKAFQPFTGRVEALSLSWVRGQEDYEVVGRYELSGQR